MVPSDAFWNDVLEVTTAEHFEIKEFETKFLKLELLSKKLKQGR